MALLCLITMGADNHPTTVPSENSANEIEYDDSPHDRYMKRLVRRMKRFQVRDCPKCGGTTVVDSNYDKQRCDWIDKCNELFDISDAELSDNAYMDGTRIVRNK